MKKIISLFLGCLAAIFVSVSFSACNNKDNASIDDAALLGSWYWDNQQYQMYYSLIVNADHTGSVTLTGNLPSTETVEFSWRVEGTIVHLVFSEPLPGINALGNTLDVAASFNAQGQLLFTLVSDPSISFGPFTRSSAPSMEGQPGQPGNQPLQPSDQPTSQLSITKANLAGDWQLTGSRDPESSTFSMWAGTRTTITLTSIGGYTTEGFFGNGSGTYTLAGSYVTVYADGLSNPLANFIVSSLTNNELILQMEGDYYFKFNKIVY